MSACCTKRAIRERQVGIRLDVQPNIGVERQEATALLPREEREKGAADRLHDERERAGVNAPDIGAQQRQVFGPHRAVGGASAIEGIERLTVRAEVDHAQRRRQGDPLQQVRPHPLGLERAGKALTQPIGRQAGEERHRLIEPGEPDGDVEWRAADPGVECQATRGVLREKIPECFAADHEHHRAPAFRRPIRAACRASRGLRAAVGDAAGVRPSVIPISSRAILPGGERWVPQPAIPRHAARDDSVRMFRTQCRR